MSRRTNGDSESFEVGRAKLPFARATHHCSTRCPYHSHSVQPSKLHFTHLVTLTTPIIEDSCTCMTFDEPLAARPFTHAQSGHPHSS